jgi:hypothetical protein
MSEPTLRKGSLMAEGEVRSECAEVSRVPRNSDPASGEKATRTPMRLATEDAVRWTLMRRR